MLEGITELKRICDVIAGQIEMYYGDGTYLMLSILAIECLYIARKDLRYKFLVPICVIMLIAWNPILYKYVFRRIRYWRLMWMIPTTILIAAALVVILKKTKKTWTKWAFVIIVAMFIATNDVNVFLNNDFYARQNWEKIPQKYIDVADVLLEIDDTPKVILPYIMTEHIRQYAPEISMLYGRNGKNQYIRLETNELLSVRYAMESQTPDYNYILTKAVEKEVNVIVVEIKKEIDEMILDAYGYKQIVATQNYIVYYNEEI